MSMGGFYFITDRGLSERGILRDIEDAIAGGATVVQYRRKDGDTRTLFE
ncbi:MAG TPA: thiamine phosphate synthase, partial [Thermoplasmata archaeon]|nr:thiamine phosphate synthase [Thermoplasmata archaeon]